MRVRFLRCILDPEARSLARDGASVHLTPKAFDVLALLVARPPRAIATSELLDAIWPGTFVTDASLARTIHEVRMAIGDDGKEGAVRTVHGYGYAFAAEAHEEPGGSPRPHPHGRRLVEGVECRVSPRTKVNLPEPRHDLLTVELGRSALSRRHDDTSS